MDFLADAMTGGTVALLLGFVGVHASAVLAARRRRLL